MVVQFQRTFSVERTPKISAKAPAPRGTADHCRSQQRAGVTHRGQGDTSGAEVIRPLPSRLIGRPARCHAAQPSDLILASLKMTDFMWLPRWLQDEIRIHSLYPIRQKSRAPIQRTIMQHNYC